MLDLPASEVQALVLRSPTLLTCAPASMTAKMEALQELTGLSEKQVRVCVHGRVVLL